MQITVTFDSLEEFQKYIHATQAPAGQPEAPKAEEKPKKEAKKQMVDRGKVVALAKAKWSIAKIADEMRCSQQTVRNILRVCMTEGLKKEEDDGKH